MLTIIENGTIRFDHGRQPKGNHKTYATWLPRHLEKVRPILLSQSCYSQLIGEYYTETGKNPLRERRSDNRMVLVIGDVVFDKREPTP